MYKYKRYFSLLRNPVVLLPALSLAVNLLAYYGGRLLASGKPHRYLELPYDSQIPFMPWAVVIYIGYFLLWAGVFIYIAWRKEARTYQLYCADLLGKLVCFFFFAFMPTTTSIRPSFLSLLTGSGLNLWTLLLSVIYFLDEPNNLFPSIHCMVSWLCFIGIRGARGVSTQAKTAVFVISAAVCWSTLATRQHVIADVVSGIALAEITWWVSGRLVSYNRSKNTTLARFLKRKLGF